MKRFITGYYRWKALMGMNNMNKKNSLKKVLLLLFPLFLSGCTVQYNLKINEDLSADEEFIAKVDYGYFDHLEKDTNYAKQYCKELINDYNSDYAYNWDYVEEEEEYGVKMYRHHPMLEDVNTAPTVLGFYDGISISEDGNFLTLKTVGTLRTQMINTKAEQIPSEEMEYSYIKIPRDTYFSITVPFQVVSHNADRVDSIHNTYYWDIYEDTTEKPIEITFDLNNKHFSFIGSALKVGKSLNYKWLLFLLIIVIILVLGKKISDKNKLNNEI